MAGHWPREKKTEDKLFQLNYMQQLIFFKFPFYCMACKGPDFSKIRFFALKH